MPKRTSYAQGTPSWVDLQTTDPEAAKTFYGGLFGWQFDDQAMPQGGTYSMALKNGDVVAAISPQVPEVAAQGLPPFWNTYITVDDVDAATAAVADAGGRVYMAPFEVMDAGRMSTVADPTGAVVNFWQPRRHIGATLVNEPGSLIWNELLTDNAEAAYSFYAAVLGLSTEASDLGDMAYTVFKVGDEMVGARWRRRWRTSRTTGTSTRCRCDWPGPRKGARTRRPGPKRPVFDSDRRDGHFG